MCTSCGDEKAIAKTVDADLYAPQELIWEGLMEEWLKAFKKAGAGVAPPNMVRHSRMDLATVLIVNYS